MSTSTPAPAPEPAPPVMWVEDPGPTVLQRVAWSLYAACATITLPFVFLVGAAGILVMPVVLYAAGLAWGAAKIRPDPERPEPFGFLCILVVAQAAVGCVAAIGLWTFDLRLAGAGMWGMELGVLPGLLLLVFARGAGPFFLVTALGFVYLAFLL